MCSSVQVWICRCGYALKDYSLRRPRSFVVVRSTLQSEHVAFCAPKKWIVSMEWCSLQCTSGTHEAGYAMTGCRLSILSIWFYGVHGTVVWPSPQRIRSNVLTWTVDLSHGPCKRSANNGGSTQQVGEFNHPNRIDMAPWIPRVWSRRTWKLDAYQ
jgi:hypothetical protein